MSRPVTDLDEAVRLAASTLADLERLRSSEQALLSSAATRAHAALARALACVAPDAFDRVGS